jgi:hypothetical protein
MKVPKSIKTFCPQCGKSGEFMLKANFYQVKKTGVFAEANCSECKKQSEFIIMLIDATENKEAEVYIYDPSASSDSMNRIERNKNIPKDLVRSYRSALNVSQVQDNAATAVMSKRVLESILKNFIGEKIKGLSISEQFDQLPKYVDLTQPLQALSHLVHPDSPFNKVLELEKDIDDEMAELIMELLEGLIEYLFVLPEKIESVHDRIDQKLK